MVQNTEAIAIFLGGCRNVVVWSEIFIAVLIHIQAVVLVALSS